MIAPSGLCIQICVFGAAISLVSSSAGCQDVGAPVADALRANTKESGAKLLLVIDAVASDRFSFRPSQLQMTFEQLALLLADRNDHLCGRIAGVASPDRSDLSDSAPKNVVVDRIRETFQFCNDAFGKLTDANLGDTIIVDVRNERLGPPRPRTRASAIGLLISYWADTDAQLSQYLRLTGRIPPIPCTGEIELNCASGEYRCFETSRGVEGSTFILSDSGYTVTSDGRGRYLRGTSNVIITYAGRAAVMVFGAVPSNSSPRAIRVDLSRPVPGGGGIALGTVTDSSDLEVGAQMQMDPTYLAHSVVEIPIGRTVPAAQTDVQFHINGVTHALQMGQQPVGHCFSDGTAIRGSGTSQGTVTRRDSTTWEVDLPRGSVGRLFDVHLGYPNAIDRGLYYVSLHFLIKK